MKLNNKGFFTPETTVVLALLVAIGHSQYSAGKWGKNGSENLQAKQYAIVANGGHINTAPNSQRKTFDYYTQP